MVNQLFVVYDKVSQRYGSVHVFATEEQANRYLPPAIVEKYHTLGDYELCHVGSIDPETGVIETFPAKRVPWTSPTLNLLHAGESVSLDEIRSASMEVKK